MINITVMRRQVAEAEQIGVKIAAAEVGPQTWEGMIELIELGSGKKIPPEKRATITDMQFMGIPVRRNTDAPEGKLWPLETVKQ